MDGRTDGRTDSERTDGRTDGRTASGRTDGRTDGRSDGQTDGRTHGRTDSERTTGRSDGRTESERTDGAGPRWIAARAGSGSHCDPVQTPISLDNGHIVSDISAKCVTKHYASMYKVFLYRPL